MRMTGGSSPVTGIRVVTLAGAWVAVVAVAGPSVGLYYATFASWAVVPPLGLVYAYCASHRGRATARLAIVATAVAAVVIGLATLLPEATAV